MKILNNEIPTRIYFWNKERGLLKPPVFDVEISFLLEESSEYYRLPAVFPKLDALGDLVVFAIGWLSKLSVTQLFPTATYAYQTTYQPKNIVGGIYDILDDHSYGEYSNLTVTLEKLVYTCLSGMYELGYDPSIVMDEVVKHIESRVGSVGESGKWEKDKTAILYEPNFTLALLPKE